MATGRFAARDPSAIRPRRGWLGKSAQAARRAPLGECPSDRSAEFQSAFHYHVLDKGVGHRYSKPRTPRLNGKVERSHRIDAEEFYALLDGLVIDDAKIFNNKLKEWEDYYNYHRPHGGLAGQTPYERLRQITATPAVTDDRQSHTLGSTSPRGDPPSGAIRGGAARRRSAATAMALAASSGGRSRTPPRHRQGPPRPIPRSARGACRAAAIGGPAEALAAAR